MKYKHWQKNVEDLVLHKRESFTLSSIARELGLKPKKYVYEGTTYRTYEKISSVNYQLMRLVNKGELQKVGTYYVCLKMTNMTVFRALVSYARRFIKKFEKLGQRAYENTVKYTKLFVFFARKVLTSD